MKPIFSDLASRQIAAIYDAIATDNITAAGEVVARILEIADFVAEFPGAGHATIRPGLRAIPANPYPYVVLFRHLPRKKTARIVQVRHGARRRPGLQDAEAEFRV